MKNLVLLMLVFTLICPNVCAMKVYSYDSNGNRVYQEITSRYGTDKRHLKTSSTRTYTNDYDPRAAYEMQGSTTYLYGPDGKRTGRIKRTGDGNVYIYGADGQRVGRYKTVSNKSVYASRASRTSYRVQPSGAFYNTRPNRVSTRVQPSGAFYR